MLCSHLIGSEGLFDSDGWVSPEDRFETGTGNSFRNIREELQADLAKAKVAFL